MTVLQPSQCHHILHCDSVHVINVNEVSREVTCLRLKLIDLTLSVRCWKIRCQYPYSLASLVILQNIRIAHTLMGL